MKWIEALKIFNKRHAQKWCVPRKGTPEHAEVRAIMASDKKEAEKKVVKEAAEEAAVVKAMGKKKPILKAKEAPPPPPKEKKKPILKKKVEEKKESELDLLKERYLKAKETFENPRETTFFREQANKLKNATYDELVIKHGIMYKNGEFVPITEEVKKVYKLPPYDKKKVEDPKLEKLKKDILYHQEAASKADSQAMTDYHLRQSKISEFVLILDYGLALRGKDKFVPATEKDREFAEDFRKKREKKKPILKKKVEEAPPAESVKEVKEKLKIVLKKALKKEEKALKQEEKEVVKEAAKVLTKEEFMQKLLMDAISTPKEKEKEKEQPAKRKAQSASEDDKEEKKKQVKARANMREQMATVLKPLSLGYFQFTSTQQELINALKKVDGDFKFAIRDLRYIDGYFTPEGETVKESRTKLGNWKDVEEALPSGTNYVYGGFANSILHITVSNTKEFVNHLINEGYYVASGKEKRDLTRETNIIYTGSEDGEAKQFPASQWPTKVPKVLQKYLREITLQRFKQFMEK